MQHLFSCTPSSKLPLIKQHSFHFRFNCLSEQANFVSIALFKTKVSECFREWRRGETGASRHGYRICKQGKGLGFLVTHFLFYFGRYNLMCHALLSTSCLWLFPALLYTCVSFVYQPLCNEVCVCSQLFIGLSGSPASLIFWKAVTKTTLFVCIWDLVSGFFKGKSG